MPPQSEILNDIKQVLEITSRVDERAKLIQLTQQEMATRINQLASELSNIGGRVMVLESKNGGKIHEIEDEIKQITKRLERIDVSDEITKGQYKDLIEGQKNFSEKIGVISNRVQVLENNNDSWQVKVNHYGGMIVQAIWIIIVCWILYKLGISTPPTP